MHQLSFDMLMLYIGLNLKTHFNYYPQSLSAQNQNKDDENTKGHDHLLEFYDPSSKFLDSMTSVWGDFNF